MLESFYKASIREQATPDPARHVRRFLQSVEHSPELRFEVA